MSVNKRRTVYAIGILVAGVTALTAAIISTRTKGSPAKGGGRDTKADWGQVAIVVSALDNYQTLLDSNPHLLLVGTKKAKLRGNVRKTDEYRVIETETEKGWEHIVKHLRPDTVILSQGLSGDNIGNFATRVLLMEDAYTSL